MTVETEPVTERVARKPSGRDAGSESVSVLEVITPVIRRWRLAVGVPLAFGLIAAVASLLMRPKFTATTTFTPASSSQSNLPGGLGSLVGLASQFGLSGLGQGGGFSPDFFAEVLRSRELLRAAVLSQFSGSATGSKHILLDLMRIPGRTPVERIEEGIRQLDASISTNVDKTGIVEVAVRQRSASLAAQVANRLIELLNTFNLERRQSQSHEQRVFTEKRMGEAENELRAAERTQLRFLQTNRSYQESPMLAYEAARLLRDVQLKQEVFITLNKAYEEARIAEVRDTPVLTVIDRATPPERRTSPRRVRMVMVATLIGGVLAIGAIFVAELIAGLRRDRPDDFQEFRRTVAQARRQIGSLRGRR